jgi:arginine utilization protein RocB
LPAAQIEERLAVGNFASRLVNLFNTMERQGYVGNLLFTSVPKEEHIFFVASEEVVNHRFV